MVTKLDFRLTDFCLRWVKRGNAMRTTIMSGQFKFPFLSKEILAKSMMRLFFYQNVARSFEDSIRSDENALRPENNFMTGKASRGRD